MSFRGKILFISALIVSISLNAQQRKNIYIPDIPGYMTLKCDFHTHTVFSDGLVWPSVRVAEAWLEGLDAIAISDHIEYRPNSNDIVSDFNRSYDIALPAAQGQGLLLIKAAEISRDMPPGHLNVLFIKNANLLERDDVFDALQEAKDQGAFIFWNHPGWKAQQPDTTLWWEEHTRLFENGLLQGIEVYNGEYSPEALGWANEKKLAILCNTDVHGLISMEYSLPVSHRPMTLVFAKEKSEESLKEALLERRSVAWYENKLVGPAEFLEPLCYASLEIEQKPLSLSNKKVVSVEIRNISDIDYDLELIQQPVGVKVSEIISVKAHHSTNIIFRGNSDEVKNLKSFILNYKVNNLITAPGSNLIVALNFVN